MLPQPVLFDQIHRDMVMEMCRGVYRKCKIALYKNSSVILFLSSEMKKSEISLTEMIMVTLPHKLYRIDDEYFSDNFYHFMKNIHRFPNEMIELLYEDYKNSDYAGGN